MPGKTAVIVHNTLANNDIGIAVISSLVTKDLLTFFFINYYG